MSSLTQNQWTNLTQALLSQLDSDFGQQRVNCFKMLPYFFEGWFQGECVNAATSAFGITCKISKGEEFQRIENLDIGLDVDGNLCALELKHIPTQSREAKSRFIGHKGSNAVKDFQKLYSFNPRNHILCKLLFLYGPTQLTHEQGYACEIEKRQPLTMICLKCAMNAFIQKTGVQNVNWRYYKLQISEMYVVEVDI